MNVASRMRAETLRSGVRRIQPFAVPTYCLAILGVCSLALIPSAGPLPVAMLGAILCGWSEVDGACGLSHVSTLTPTRAVGNAAGLWLKAVTAYTGAGLVTAAAVGLSIGALGVSVADLSPNVFLAVMIVVAAVLIGREVGLLDITLPQIKLQTEKMWFVRFGVVTAAGMWGAHIGLGFFTVIQHGGIFVVGASSLHYGPAIGAALMAAFWLGRTLPIWLAPFLTSHEKDGGEIANFVLNSARAYRSCAAIGLLLLMVAAMV